MDSSQLRVLECGQPSTRIVVKRNCSLSPRQALLFLGLATAAAFGIGIGFAWFGLWVVLPFAGLEIAALAIAFYVNGRHAADREQFELREGKLVVEIHEAGRVSVYEFQASWVRFAVEQFGRDVRVYLASHGRKLEIGRHLRSEGRHRLVGELKARLARDAAGPGFTSQALGKE